MTYQLHTLGALDLHDAQGKRITGILAHPKWSALLVYLVVADSPSFSRDALTAIFWPKAEREKARAALRRAVAAYRRALGDAVIVTKGQGLVVGRDQFVCDALALRAANDVETARKLAEDSFLSGFSLPDAPEFEEWAARQRQHLDDHVAALIASTIVAPPVSEPAESTVEQPPEPVAEVEPAPVPTPERRVARDPDWDDAFRALWRRRPLRVAAMTMLAVAATWQGWNVYDASDADAPPVTTAVTPFAYHGSRTYSYLAAGMPTLLGTSLEGAGMHTADAARARYVVAGAIVEAGGRLRVSAELRDARDRKVVARAAAEDSASRIFTLVDQVAARLVSTRPGSPRKQRTYLAAVTTASLPALRSFLDGETQIRVGRYREAQDAYRRAVVDDSGFALAHYRMAIASGWSRDTVSQDMIHAAERMSDRLSSADRAKLDAYLAYARGDAEDAERRYRAILERRPYDGEAAFQLGEVLFHHNPARGRSIQESWPMFERALLDGPRDAALTHLLEIAGVNRDYAAFDSLSRLLSPTSPFASTARLVRAFARGSAAEKTRLLDQNATLPDAELAAFARHMVILVDDRESAGRGVRLLLQRGRPRELRALGYVLLAYVEAGAGRLQAADAALRSAESLDRLLALHHRGLLESLPFLPVGQAQRLGTREALITWSSDIAASQYLIGLLSVQVGDTGMVDHSVSRLDRMGDPVAEAYMRGVRAQSYAARGEPADALREVERVRGEVAPEGVESSPFGGNGRERFLRAEMLRRLERDEEALQWYRSLETHAEFDRVYLAQAHLRMGEILERAGRFDEAALEYGKFVTLWKRCDPALQTFVSDARARIVRLRR